MPSIRINDSVEVGQNTGRGNLVGMQPYLTPRDFSSEDAFRAALRPFMEAAHERGWLNPFSVVVFPEYTGVFLAASGGRPSVYQATRTAQAMQSLVMPRLLRFVRALLASPEADRATASFFRLMAAQAAEVFQRVFSWLAREYQVTIVAGSIILPEPSVIAGKLTPGRGPLYNVSAVFSPEGRLFSHLTRKVYPIDSEKPFLRGGNVVDLPVYPTVAGRMGVLVCADSWYPLPYQQLRNAQVDFVVVPSFLTGNNLWDKPWKGYNGHPAPEDVDPNDIDQIAEGEAWHKYALPGRLAASGARVGMNVFLHGEIWEYNSNSGLSQIIVDGQIYETRSDGTALLNLWL